MAAAAPATAAVVAVAWCLLRPQALSLLQLLM
jgi:hypothetical protein